MSVVRPSDDAILAAVRRLSALSIAYAEGAPTPLPVSDLLGGALLFSALAGLEDELRLDVSGEALFDRVGTMLDDAAQREDAGVSLDKGQAGLLFVLDYLSSSLDVEVDPSVLSVLDARLSAAVDDDAMIVGLDLLYGAGGVAVAASRRLATESGRALASACVRAFERHGVARPANVRFAYEFDGCKHNIGVAHGLAGLAASAQAFANAGIPGATRLADALRGHFLDLFATYTSRDDGRSLLPTLGSGASAIHNKDPLGWCFGDLGIAAAVAPLVVANGASMSPLMPVLHRCCSLVQSETPKTFADFTLCHGVAGHAMMLGAIAECSADAEIVAARDRALANLVHVVLGDTLERIDSERRRETESALSIVAGEAGVVLLLLSELGLIPRGWDAMFAMR